MQIPLNAYIVASSDQVSTITGGEVVILGLSNGVYYGLNEVGRAVWEALKSPIKVSDICEKIKAEFDTNEQECESDLRTLLDDLYTHQLISIQSEPNDPS
jgi:hypothetical protein